MQKRKIKVLSYEKIIKSNLVLIVVSIPLLIEFIGYRRFVRETVLFGNPDARWVQAMTLVTMRSDFLGKDGNIAWPSGLDMWSHPQLGLLFQVLVKFISLFIQNESTVLLITFVAIGILNILAFRFLLIKIKDKFKLDINLFAITLLSLTVGLNPFFLTKIAHLNVASFWLLILIFYAFLCSGRNQRKLWVSLSAGAALAPLWWVVVGILISSIMLILDTIQNRQSVKHTIKVNLMLWIGTTLQLLLYVRSKVQDAPNPKRIIDSNVYGGHLIDIFQSSPYLNEVFPFIFKSSELTSTEWNAVGIFGLVFIVISMIQIINYKKLKFKVEYKDEFRIIINLWIICLLFFLTGGLGNLLAGFMSWVDITSPARAWSRIILPFSMVSAIFVVININFMEISKKLNKQYLYSFTAIIIFSITLLDAETTGKVPTVDKNTIAEYGPVNYLKNNLEPCPVLQIPIGGYPLERVWTSPEDYETIYYRGFLPYLLEPTFKWSYGNWNPKKNELPIEVNSVLNSREEQKIFEIFCAVLYNKKFAIKSEETGIMVEGTIVKEWIRKPVFSNEIYDLYVK